MTIKDVQQQTGLSRKTIYWLYDHIFAKNTDRQKN